MTALVAFEDVKINLTPDRQHEWLISSADVEAGYGVPRGTLRSTKSRNEGELVEGKHYANVLVNSNVAVGYAQPPTRPKVMWTKRGVVRLGFLLEGPRARRFRDFAEDLVLEKLEAPKTPAEALLGAVQQMVEQERRLAANEARTEAVATKVEGIEAKLATLTVRPAGASSSPTPLLGKPEWERLATLLKARRDELGLTQQQLVTRAGISHSAYTPIETLRLPYVPGVRTLRSIAIALGWTPQSCALVLAGGNPIDASKDETLLLSPTTIGALIHPRCSGKAVNDLLVEHGYQWKNLQNGTRTPTVKGAALAEITTREDRDGGIHLQLRWRPEIVGRLTQDIARKTPKNNNTKENHR